jgi:hypothetical protein
MNAEKRVELLHESLKRHYEVNVIITSFTVDGAAVNIKMFKLLGASLDLNNLRPWFIHPCDISLKVYIFLDPSHMLKLVRNVFESKNRLFINDSEIKFEYIKHLYNIQSAINLRLGNKLTKNHIEFHNNKMNVKLAAQLLSNSNADAVRFCIENGISGFQGAEVTVDFLLNFNNAFDKLNARNPRGKGSKCPIFPYNLQDFREQKTILIEYIKKIEVISEEKKKLKTKKPKPRKFIVNHSSNTGFLGFIIDLESLFLMAEDVLNTEIAPLRYLLSYKVSQDHLENWHAQIRQRNGFSMNPTARQLTSAIKALLSHAQIKISNGNCALLENVPILQKKFVQQKGIFYLYY